MKAKPMDLFLPGNPEPAATRIVVAMSGGVDSSVTAGLVKEAGYDAVGITLQLYDHGEAMHRKGACCAGQDIHDARNVADTLGMPHYVLDYESRFKEQVIDTFRRQLSGRRNADPLRFLQSEREVCRPAQDRA
jgi:tRNA-specific 2-thiouridylase